MAKGGSRASNTILSFILGFLFAIIVEIVSLVIAALIVLNAKIDTVLGFVNIDNSNHEYVNTEDYETVSDIINLISDDWLKKDELGNLNFLSKSLGDINDVFPLVKNAVLGKANEMTEGILFKIFDEDELMAQPFTELVGYIRESVMEMEGAVIADLIPEDENAETENSVIKSLLMGAETQYATVKYSTAPMALSSESKNYGFPVMYDVYAKSGDDYTRKHIASGYAYEKREEPDADGKPVYIRKDFPAVKNGGAFHENLGEELLKSTAINNEYRLYYVPCKVTQNAILPADFTEKTYYRKSSGGSKFTVIEYAKDTDFIAVSANDDGEYILNHENIWQSLNPSVGEGDMSNRFKGYSYDVGFANAYFYCEEISISEGVEIYTVSGLNYFKDKNGEKVNLKKITLNTLIDDTFAPLKAVSVASVLGNNDELVSKIFGDMSLGDLLDKNSDKGFKELIDNLELSVFINNVDPNNKLMASIVYKLSDVVPNDDADGTYSAIYDKSGENIRVKVTVNEQGNIDKVIDPENAEHKCEGAKVSSIASLTDDITIDVLMDVQIDNATMMYLGYGITGVYPEEGVYHADPVNPDEDFVYQYRGIFNVKAPEEEFSKFDCYISVNENGDIKTAYYVNSDLFEKVEATKVNEISSRVDDIMDRLTLPDFLAADPSDAITTYVSYGISDVQKVSETDYTGKYTHTVLVWHEDGEGAMISSEEERVEDCYMTVAVDEKSNKPKIKTAWYMDGSKRVIIRGTTVNNVPDRIDGMKNTVTIGEIIVINENSTKILQSLSGTTINGLDDRIQVLTIEDLFTEKEIDDSVTLKQLKGTKLTELASAIDSTLIQRIYTKEVYGFPEDCDPFEMIAFNESDTFYHVVKSIGEDGKKKYEFEIINKGEANEGRLTLSEFSNRGTNEYYTRQVVGVDEEEQPIYTYKIVGYRIENIMDGVEVVDFNVRDFRIGWLYYEYNEEKGSYELCDKHAKDVEDENEKYDKLGNLDEADIKQAIKDGKKHYTYGEAIGMWRLVLYKKVDFNNDGNPTLVEKAYTINNFNNMIAVCTTNIYGATLKELHDAEIIKVDEEKLNKKICVSLGGVQTYFTAAATPTADAGEGVALKDLTFERLIYIVVNFLVAA